MLTWLLGWLAMAAGWLWAEWFLLCQRSMRPVLTRFWALAKTKRSVLFLRMRFFAITESKNKKIPETGGEEGKVKGKIRRPHHVSLYVSRPKHFRYHWNFSMCLFIMCSIIPCIFSFVGDPQDVSPIVSFQTRCFLYRYKKHGCFLYRLGYEPVEKQKAHLPFCFLHAARTGVSQKTAGFGGAGLHVRAQQEDQVPKGYI